MAWQSKADALCVDDGSSFSAAASALQSVVNAMSARGVLAIFTPSPNQAAIHSLLASPRSSKAPVSQATGLPQQAQALADGA